MTKEEYLKKMRKQKTEDDLFILHKEFEEYILMDSYLEADSLDGRLELYREIADTTKIYLNTYYKKEQ